MDALTILVDDHRRIVRLFDAVSNGDTTTVPQVCEALLLHSRMEEEVLYPTIHGNLEAKQWDVSAALEDHLIMRRLISELAEGSSDSPSYLTKAGVLMRLVRDHVREEEDILFPQIESALEPGLAEELRIALERVHDTRAAGAADAGQDPGASSDGDASWAESPLTQDPQVDRSVDAVIRRTQGA